MSNSEGSRSGRLFKAFFNPRLWMNYSGLKETYDYLINGLCNLFVVRKAKPAEPLDKVMERMSLSEDDIIVRKKAFFRLSILMLFVALLVFIYLLFHLFHGHWLAVLVSSVAILLSLALAFRYHFWYYQLKVRKLGCTFREWFRHGLLGVEHE